MTDTEALSFDDNEVYITMCPPTTKVEKNDLGEAVKGMSGERSTAKDLRYTSNACLLHIGEGIVNIGDEVNG